MAEDAELQSPKDRKVPRLVLSGLVVVVLVLSGFWMVERVRDDGTLPPGFTITTGGDSGDRAGQAGSPGDSEDLGALIAAAVPEGRDLFEASIAILPLENRTGDTLFDTLGTGMADELIARLSRIRGLKVIDRQSVQELEGLSLSAAEVADTLDVDHLLLGTAFPHQDAARIQVRLLQVEEDAELWRSDYSLDRRNQMRAVEEISDEVSAALLEEVPTLSLRASSGRTDSPGHPAYLAGRRLLNTRTRDGLIRAAEVFKSAIALDSTFAPAYAGLSSAYALSVTYRYDIGVDAFAAAARALKAAEEAVRLDPDLAEAYAARGYISSVALAPAAPVLADFSRAMELQPNTPNVPAWMANFLVREGYYERALESARRAVALDPLSPARHTGLAFEALRAGDYGLAIKGGRDAADLGPGVILPRSIQALALLLSGRTEECLDMDLGPHAGIRAMCLHDHGRVEEATAITDSLRTILQSGDRAHSDFTNVIPAGDLAAYLAWTGSPERALPWIYRAFDLSPSGIDQRVLESGVFEGLLADSEMRREVSGIRERIWPRVLRELAEAEILAGAPGR